MAEIRSTMEMVLERAARLEAEAGDSLVDEEKMQEGMRLAARYLRDEATDFAALQAKHPPEQQQLLQGALTVLLRNITLPREEMDQAAMEKALQGLLELGEDPQLQAVIAEMKKILGQYLQHKKQLHGQLEEQFAQQMGMLEQSMGPQAGMPVNLEPSQHPKFAEEWQKVMDQLNEQYGNALDQHKAYIEQLISA